MQFLKDLKDYVPLFQTLTWAILVVSGVIVFRRQLGMVLEGIYKATIQQGRSLEIGQFFKLGEEIRDLERVETVPDATTVGTAIQAELKITEERVQHRHDIEERNREVYLVHVLDPSTKAGQKYDIFIYLIRHRSTDYSDIKRAEFFFGRHWGNRVFEVENRGKAIGVSTSAYGPFLCTCRVVFVDGYEVMLDRYIDFEMGKALET